MKALMGQVPDITQEHHKAALDTLSIMSQTMKWRLPDLDAL